jgi:hypothetical protein
MKKYLPKDVHKLTDKEVLPHLFPPDVIKKIKQDASATKLKIVKK